MLLRGGTVLLHGTNDKVEAVQKDILIEAGKICKIENNIRVSSDIEIVDCEDTIISPGFIDTRESDAASHCFTVLTWTRPSRMADTSKRPPRE